MLLTAAVTSWQPHTERKRCSGVRSGSSSEHCGRYMRGHRRPAQPPTANWQPLVDSYLSSYAGGVSRSDVDYAEAWAANASQFTAAGSWRARVVNGSLWVRPIHFYEHWKERASVLRILLLAAQQASALGEPLPDSELVFAAADSDPTVLHSRRRCHAPNTSATLHGRRRTRPAANCPRLPVFVHARASALGSTALPLPEYSWVGSYHSPPWCQMQPRFERAAAAWGWEQRDARAYFGGACSTGISRQSLLPLNRTHGELLHVLDVGFGRSGFVNPHDVERAKRSYARLGVGWGNFSAQLPPDYACRFQVLLSVPGFGYSNRLRQLLACGSAVVHVQHARV
uniref:Glycosyl transferase CAP10 domain-containing protein n=1 Tax=Emiliania huxleyi TaxID=2903 RepID=A0A7S3T7A0_EMIHU